MVDAIQEVAALQGTAQGGKRYRAVEEAAAQLTAAEDAEAGLELQHALKQRPADGSRPVKLYRGGHLRAEAANDNGTGIVGSTTGLLPGMPGANQSPPAHLYSPGMDCSMRAFCTSLAVYLTIARRKKQCFAAVKHDPHV